MSIPSPSPLGPLQDDPASGLSFRLREPRPAAPKALLLLLHGVGGNEGNLAPLADAADPDMLVVLPRGPLAFAPGQYGWFRVAFTADGPSIDAAEAEQSRLALIRLIGQLQAAWRIEPRHTVIAGFSQGGILSASVGLTAPHSVAGFAVLSGRILPELEPQLADRTQLAGLRAFALQRVIDFLHRIGHRAAYRANKQKGPLARSPARLQSRVRLRERRRSITSIRPWAQRRPSAGRACRP